METNRKFVHKLIYESLVQAGDILLRHPEEDKLSSIIQSLSIADKLLYAEEVKDE